MNCPPDCPACREIPIDPPRTLLEAATAGFGLGVSVWFSGWVIYSIGSWIVRVGAGTASLIWLVTCCTLGGLWSVTSGRR